MRLYSGQAGRGLLSAASDSQVVRVEPLSDHRQAKSGENTFQAVAQAYSILQGGSGRAQPHYGPYALVLHHVPYADTYAPLATTLVMPADRIKPLVTEGFFGTGTLPELRGLFVSVGGNTLDLVVSVDTMTAFLQEDSEGQFRFRVFERFALRVKDETSIIRLEFYYASKRTPS